MRVLTTTLISPQGRFAEGTPLSDLPDALAHEAAELGCVGNTDDAPLVIDVESTPVAPAAGAPLLPGPVVGLEPAPVPVEVTGLILDEDGDPDIPGLMSGHWRSVKTSIECGAVDSDLEAAEALEQSRDGGPRASILKALKARSE